ncbi:MAG: cytochrome [Devosia sp.]|uniref:cytochrome P450 n=1 Tax=Devosia sp. TaxID=1871048 RepID=UPI00262EB3E5|nr:cytochrome P450 [Devosia sp.]MDB5539494.1 cytochrome [Devosia sp.]
MSEAGSAELTASLPPARIAPMSKGLPVLGNLLDIGLDPFGAFEKWSAQYGEIVRLQLGAWPTVLLNGSDLIEQVLVKQHENFTKHRFFWRHVALLTGTGLFTSEGKFWQRQRKLAAPAFAGDRLKSYDTSMTQLTEKMLDNWPDDTVIDLRPEMMALGLKIAAKTMFSAEVEADVKVIEQAMGDILAEISRRYSRLFLIPDAVPLPGHIRYRRGVAAIEGVVARLIDERRGSSDDRGDLISMLMAARDDDGKPMTDTQLRDEVLTMLLAGYETSALTMCWAFYALSQQPEIQDAIAAEVEATVGDRPIRNEDLQHLKVTENVVIETLRLYPAAWAIGREAKEDCRIGDYDVPAGTTVYMSSWAVHRNPAYYEDPLAFKPQRWSGDLRRTLPRFAYFPFGGGPRICIGNRFAMMEAMLLIATICRRYRLEQHGTKPLVPFPTLTLRPASEVWARLKRRN